MTPLQSWERPYVAQLVEGLYASATTDAHYRQLGRWWGASCAAPSCPCPLPVDTLNVASAAIVSGKLYLSLSNGLVIDCGQAQGPQGLAGPPGPPGPNGRPGTDGNSVLHGAGLPLPTDGRQNDLYVDTVDLRFYGPKSGAGWGSGVALRPEARALTLPNGMKAQQGDPAYPRVFAGAMAGGSGGPGTPGVVQPTGMGTGAPILIHQQSLAAGAPTSGTPAGPGGVPPAVAPTPAVWTPIAIDSNGHALVADVYAAVGGWQHPGAGGCADGQPRQHRLQRGVRGADGCAACAHVPSRPRYQRQAAPVRCTPQWPWAPWRAACCTCSPWHAHLGSGSSGRGCGPAAPCPYVLANRFALVLALMPTANR